MKRLICVACISVLLTGCVVMDTTSSVFKTSGEVVKNIMSGGKVHFTVGIETDAAYNNSVKPVE